jgi:predicted phage-related endonuclease
MNEQELERRRPVVGASEVGLLFGLPAFGGRTVSDLWYEKKFGTIRGGTGNASTNLGTKLEPVVLEWAQERIGLPIVDRQKWVMVDCNGATLDGRVINDGPVVEAKTSGVLWRADDSWGDDGSDEVPENYLLQVQAQMLVTGAELAYLAALIGGRGFCMFEIKSHAGLQYAIRQKSTEFIASLSLDDEPANPPQLETLKRLRRQPKKVSPRSEEFEELRLQLEEAKATAKESTTHVEQIQARLLAMFGDAEAVECNGGLMTYYEQTTHYKAKPASETTFRVLRFKKGA